MSEQKPADLKVQQPVASAAVCRLSKVPAGTVVRIKQLAVTADDADRFREIGLAEGRQIKLVMRQPNYVCQVASSRLWLSKDLADNILVEPLNNPI